MLGPKPKKPVEEKSLTSAIISGTKRKLQDLLGSKRGGSESTQNSPKKRKLLAGKIGSIKARNKLIASETERQRAEKEASELSRQTASREDRALKRSTPATAGRQARAANAKTTRPTVKVTRHTTVTFQRKVPRPGALKAIKKPSRAQTDIKQADAKPKGKKGVRAVQRPSTPDRETSATASESEEEFDASPNITPASLRSATRKSAQASPVVGKSSKADLNSPATAQARARGGVRAK